MKSSARVVVIGGGIVGCSVLYHLAKNGWTDVVLLERMELTSGSSWHAAGGLFTVTRPSAAAEIHRYTFQIYRELEKESGQACGFHDTGGMNICRTQEEVDSNRMMQSACRRLGIESHFMTPQEAQQKVPFLDPTCMLAALWEVEGGHVDPASATNAFAAAARKLGAEIYRHTPVLDTTQRSDQSWDVVTDQGSIHGEFIVNAAGLWGREVAAMADIHLPLAPVEHHYLVTEALPEIERLDAELPQINDNETGVYMRQEGQGMLVGAYEKTCTHWSLDGTPLDFGHELLNEDLSRMEWNFEKSIELLPCLANAGVKRVINGPMIFSPDLGPLIGPHPATPNYFCANGVMAGFNQGAGVGRVLAEWIIQGEPEIDIFCWDIARFGDWADRGYTEKTTRFFYENRSEKVFPYQEFDVGRPIHQPAVYDRLADAHAVFGASFGLEHANWFASSPKEARDTLTYRQPNWWQPVTDEGKRVRNEAGLIEFSAMAKFEVTGPEAAMWLDLIMANRLPRIGRMSLSPMLSPRGRLVGDFSVARLGEEHFFILGADAMQLVFLRHFRRFPPPAGVNLVNQSLQLGGLHLCGPNAQEILSRVTDIDLDTTSFPFMSNADTTVGNIEGVRILRVSFTGECGYELYLPMAQQPMLFDLLMREGASLGLGLVGTRALMSTRLEKLFPAWGLELSGDYTAIEAGLDRFVDFDKGDFIGREAAAAYAPPREVRAAFTVAAGQRAVWGDEAIFLDGEVVGYVTSGGFGPACERHIALGYVDPDARQVGGNYTIEILGKHCDAELQREPLYDPAGLRMRA